MAIKTIAVCGCSWSAVSHRPDYKNTHWSELISRMFDADLHNFAVGGVSNFIIRLQIDEVLKLNPDMVIVSPTYPDRIEVPFNINLPQTKNVTLSSIVNPFAGPKKDQNIKTGAIWDLENKGHPGVKDYITYFYLSEVKKKVDQYLIRDGIHQLKLKRIPVLLQPQILWDDDETVKQFFHGILNDHDIISKNYSLYYNIWDSSEGIDPGYHTTPKTQKEFAERLQKIINDTIIKL
jgi:hypothetical protein